MTDDPRYRSSREPLDRSESVADMVDVAVRRIVTGLVLAGALVGLGAYMADGAEAPRYQVTTASDGRIVRVNTDSGSLVVCQDNRCWLMQRGSNDLDDEPPARIAPPQPEARPALPAPPAAGDNAAAPAAQ